jgi:hypothetical protein
VDKIGEHTIATQRRGCQTPTRGKVFLPFAASGATEMETASKTSTRTRPLVPPLVTVAAPYCVVAISYHPNLCNTIVEKVTASPPGIGRLQTQLCHLFVCSKDKPG